MIRTLLLVVLLLGLSSPLPAEEMECPLMTWETANPNIYLGPEGARTYFCCDRCRRDFLRADSAELVEMDAGKGGWMGALGKYHPVSVHFPIAFLCLAALAELLFMVTRRDFFQQGARFNTLFGALAAPPAAFLGWCSGGWVAFPADLAGILWQHKWSGTVAAVLAVLVALASERCPERDDPGRVRLYRALLFLSAALIMVVGWLGGKLVYGP